MALSNHSPMATMQSSDEAPDPKQSSHYIKVRKACDLCYKKKTKCDGATPNCSHCTKYKISCTYTTTTRERVFRPRNRSKHITQLESRLKDLESIVKASLVPQQSDELYNASSILSNQSNSGPDTNLITPSIVMDVDAWNQATPRTGLGPLSIESVPTYPNFNFESQQRVPLASWDRLLVPSPLRTMWSFGSSLESSFTPLPSMELVTLVQEYFDEFNTIFPIYHKASFLAKFSENFSMFFIEGSSEWASLNSIISIAYRFRAMRLQDHRVEDLKSWAHLRNILMITMQVSMQTKDLAILQAILGAVIVLQGTSQPQQARFMIAIAVQLAQDMSLHNSERDDEFSPVEVQQRRRVYWLIYSLDKDISLRTCHPSLISDENVGLDLPDETPEDGIGMLIDGNCVGNIYGLRVRLARIQGQVYTKLYSARAKRSSEAARRAVIQELDEDLKAWKNTLPLEFRPTRSILSLKMTSMLHIMILNLSYFHCLTMIHRRLWVSANQSIGVWNNGVSDRPLASSAPCLAAARSSIRLVKITPQGDFAGIWLVINPLITSLVALLGSIPANVKDQKGRADLHLVTPLLVLLKRLAFDTQIPELLEISAFCVGLEAKAIEALRIEEDYTSRATESI